MSRSTFVYTAKRSLAIGHFAESTYVLELDLSDAVPSNADVKDSTSSQGGAIETTFYRQDREWQFTFAPVSSRDVELLREFLDSAESGELFRAYLYGTEAEPILLRRVEKGHAETSFMRVGSREGDLWQATISALEARIYRVDEFGEVGVGDGVETDYSESTDIYAPEIGGPTGGLDEPEEASIDLLFFPAHAVWDHVNSRFVGIGFDIGSGHYAIFTSPDGESWTNVTDFSTVSSTFVPTCIAFDGTQFVVGGGFSSGSTGSAAYASLDLSSWSFGSVPNNGAGTTLTRLYHDGTSFIALASIGSFTSGRGMVYSSPTGVVWSTAYITYPTIPAFGIGDIVRGAGKYVCRVVGNSTGDSGFYSCDDFTLSLLALVHNVSLENVHSAGALCFANSKFLALNADLTKSYSSTDGETFTEDDLVLSGADLSASSVHIQNLEWFSHLNRYLTVFRKDVDVSGEVYVATSIDGINWNVVATGVMVSGGPGTRLCTNGTQVLVGAQVV